MTRLLKLTSIAVLFAAVAVAAEPGWKPLFNSKDLDGWEPRGDCAWTVMPEGTLVGQRIHTKVTETWPLDQKDFNKWFYRQAWLYTTRNDFQQFDLHLEYWVPRGGNSGVSIRDHTRAHYAIGEPDSVHPELAGPIKSTPAHVGYEIQILDGDSDKYPSGSIYTFVPAKRGVHRSGVWNTMDIEVRDNLIRVRLNGELVAEGPGDPARPKTGPIGLQLHDQMTFAMFRNIRIREVH
jgi:Domain of Unknown Function (DUF1080)